MSTEYQQTSLTDELDAFFAQYTAANQSRALVYGLVGPDGLMHSAGFGSADDDGATPDLDTVFPIASMSKTPPVRNRREPAPSPSSASTTPSSAPAAQAPSPSEPVVVPLPAEPAAAAPVVSTADPEQIWHVLERSRAGKLEPTDGTGLLTLTTDQYAQVYLGSHLVGETPLFNVTMPTGRYVLRVVGPEGQPVKLTVDVKAGEVTKKRVSFESPTP